MEETVGFELGRNELRSLVGVLGGNVVANSTALVQNEPIVVLIIKENYFLPKIEDELSMRRLTR